MDISTAYGLEPILTIVQSKYITDRSVGNASSAFFIKFLCHNVSHAPSSCLPMSLSGAKPPLLSLLLIVLFPSLSHEPVLRWNGSRPLLSRQLLYQVECHLKF